MAERKIDPKFNIHESYQRVNIVNPYRYSSGGGGGGVSHEPETTALMASIGWADDSTPSPHNGLTYAQVYNVLDTYFAAGKTDGWLALMKAVYLFIGNNADNHKWNAVNPQDTDAAFRITWYGGRTHSATGFKGDASTGYGDTKLNQSTHLTLNSESFGVYMQENTNQIGRDISVDLKAGGSYIITNYQNIMYVKNQSDTFKTISNTTLGFKTNSRINSTHFKIQNNTVFTEVAVTSQAVLNSTFVLARQGDLYTSRQMSYAFIGYGLTEAQMLAHYNAVQQLQTDLGRNV